MSPLAGLLGHIQPYSRKPSVVFIYSFFNKRWINVADQHECRGQGRTLSSEIYNMKISLVSWVTKYILHTQLHCHNVGTGYILSRYQQVRIK